MKKLIKKSLAVILTALMLMSTVPVTVSAAEATADSIGATSGTTGDCTWALDDEGTLTISGNGAMADYALNLNAPWEKYEFSTVVIDYGVTNIGDAAFYNCRNLQHISISDTVTYIGQSAFSLCEHLINIDLPNSITSIGFRAFYSCKKLTSITIPNSVTSISESLFSCCTGLKKISIPNSVVDIGDGAFTACESLTNITIPNSVTRIGYSAFSCCENLTNITISESVTSIEEYAFIDCSSITSVVIPSSVTNIGEYALGYYFNNFNNDICIVGNFEIIGNEGTEAQFYANSNNIPFVALKKIIDSGTTGDCTWTLDEEGVLTISGNGAMSDYGFDNYAPWKSDKIKSVIIENGVTNIGNVAFAYCHNLSSVTIPDSVTSIGSYSFCGGNTKLTDITIPDSVTSIGSFAFSHCRGLTSVKIPSSVTNIGTGIFSTCSSLTNITVDSDNPTFVSIDGTLYNKNGTMMQYAIGKTDSSFVVPDSVNCIYNYALNDCDNLTSVTIPDSVTTIGYDAFSGCNGLTSVTIPESVTNISYSTFINCPNLTSVFIPNSVTNIGTKAFGYINDDLIDGFTISGYKGSAAETYAKNNGINFIEAKNIIASGTTGDCTWELDDEGTLTISGNGAMADYDTHSDVPWKSYEFTNLVIGNGVTYVDEIAFMDSDELTCITVSEGNTNYDSRNNCNAIIETESNTLISGCKSTVIPNSAKSIGDRAFQDCNYLTSITIPNGVTSIGDNAFNECSGLRSITIPNSVTKIGNYAFSPCKYSFCILLR